MPCSWAFSVMTPSTEAFHHTDRMESFLLQNFIHFPNDYSKQPLYTTNLDSLWVKISPREVSLLKAEILSTRHQKCTCVHARCRVTGVITPEEKDLRVTSIQRSCEKRKFPLHNDNNKLSEISVVPASLYLLLWNN